MIQIGHEFLIILLKNPKALVEYSDNVQDVYKNNKEYNLERRLKCY